MVDRPSWHKIIFDTIEVYKQRSLDKHTKYGAALVDENHRILAMGMNGPCRGMKDWKIDLERPGKYQEMLHAEENLLAQCACCGIVPSKHTVYIDGYPCIVNNGAPGCLKRLYHHGIRRIIIKEHQAKMIEGDWWKQFYDWEQKCIEYINLVVYKEEKLYRPMITHLGSETYHLLTTPSFEVKEY